MSEHDPRAEIELLESLGEGSFSHVYVARVSSGALRRTVVLKMLKRDWVKNDQTLKRARDEAVLLARLNHAHIVRVEQLINLGGRPVVVMEHIEGLTLDRLLAQTGALPPAVALRICSKVASALDAAVNRTPPGEQEPLRVIHRDIKPSNILLSVDGLVKVLDFGTARATFEDREARTHRTAMGSLNYMPPESVEATEPTPAVDVYALGATLFELLIAHPLGRLSVRPERHRAALKERLEKVNPPGLGDAGVQRVRELLAKMLVYEPDQRLSARDVMVQARTLAATLPGHEHDPETYAEQVLEPLYRARPRTPPAPVDGVAWAPPVRRWRGGDPMGEPATDESSAPPGTPFPLLLTPTRTADSLNTEATPLPKPKPEASAAARSEVSAPPKKAVSVFWLIAAAAGAMGLGLLLGQLI